MKKLKPIMFVGTCSDAGKSIINTAFCRIFLQDGYAPAPFKAQNMSLNSYSTPDGGEIGRAQAVQAEACRIAPSTDMNPVLLKPSSDQTSQVILNGQPVGNMSAREYFRINNKEDLWREALAAFVRLEECYSPIVLEGAGSISELNLRDRDITNMNMAQKVDAATYLVADIDRGGVFASVYGSVMLLPEEQRRLLKGIIINKFRGDVSLFDEGRKIIQDLTGIPVVGVIPYFRNIRIEEEDSVVLENKAAMAEAGKVNVAVVRLRRMSNFTDFNAIEQDGRFHLYYTDKPSEIDKADVVILPGTKNTIDDLLIIRENGVADAIMRAGLAGKKIIGICGGFQMLGKRIEDPEHVEGVTESTEGLGLFPLVTVMQTKKVVCQSDFNFKNKGSWCKGYQIHMGVTIPHERPLSVQENLNMLADGTFEGYVLNEHCWGSYMHGILDNAVVLDDLASGFANVPETGFDYLAFKEKQYDLLAEHVRAAVDLDYIYSTLQL